MSKQDKKKILILSLVFLITLFNVVYEKYFQKENDFESVYQTDEKDISYAHFIDAGQGDCTLLQTNKGKYVLIDTSTDVHNQKVVSYLENMGVTDIEYLFLTHPHEDHIGSADEVLENFTVKNVVMTDRVETTASYERLLNAIKKSKNENETKVIRPKYLESFAVDELEITVISDYSIYEDLNSSSICLKVDCGKTNLLFTGDAECEVERDILKSGIDIQAEIYKCAHHGSSTSNSKEFLYKVNPDVAVISCELDNMYGHPHEEVIDLLVSMDVDIYTTYSDGDIVFAFDENGIH